MNVSGPFASVVLPRFVAFWPMRKNAADVFDVEGVGVSSCQVAHGALHLPNL